MRAREIWMGEAFAAFDDLLDEGRTWGLVESPGDESRLERLMFVASVDLAFVAMCLAWAVGKLADKEHEERRVGIFIERARRLIGRSRSLLIASGETVRS